MVPQLLQYWLEACEVLVADVFDWDAFDHVSSACLDFHHLRFRRDALSTLKFPHVRHFNAVL